MNLCSYLLVFCRVNKAQSQPRQKRMPVSRPSFDYSESEDSNGGWNPSAASSYPSAGELVLFIYTRLHDSTHSQCAFTHAAFIVNLTAFLRWTRFDLNLISSGTHNLMVMVEMKHGKPLCVQKIDLISGKVNHAISYIKVAFAHTYSF